MKKLILFLFLSVTIHLNAQLDGLTTATALDKVSALLTDTFDQAIDRANFTVAREALKALGTIDAWEQANTNLLDTAFTSLDKSVRDAFSGMESLSLELNNNIERQIDHVDNIIVQADELSENLPFANRQSYILDYSPKVAPIMNTKTVLIALRGVNLDKAAPRLKLKSGAYLDFDILSPTIVTAEIPISELKFDDDKPRKNPIKIEHQTQNGSYLGLLPKYDDIERSLIITTLPTIAGTYTFNGLQRNKEEERLIYSSAKLRHKGSNTDVRTVIPPFGRL